MREDIDRARFASMLTSLQKRSWFADGRTVPI
jgi:hypothetical protein